MTPVEVVQGDSPIVLGLPHTGTWVPDEIWADLNDEGRLLRDTDWHIERLYDGLLAGVTTVRATFHRYVIDANRDPSGVSLYPGQNTTGLVPLTNFDDQPIWTRAPDVDSRRAFHTAYHAALRPRWRGCAQSMAWRSFGTVIRSGRKSRFCSMASCPISISERIPGPLAPMKLHKSHIMPVRSLGEPLS